MTAGILLTSAQRRRAARLSLGAERKRRPRPRHKQPNKEIVIIVFVPGLFLRCWLVSRNDPSPHPIPSNSSPRYVTLTFIRPLCHHLAKRQSNSSIFHPFNFGLGIHFSQAWHRQDKNSMSRSRRNRVRGGTAYRIPLERIWTVNKFSGESPRSRKTFVYQNYTPNRRPCKIRSIGHWRNIRMFDPGAVSALIRIQRLARG